MDEDLQRALRPLRDRIDALDAQILDLLSQRARAAQEVGEAKHAAQADGPVLRPEREAEVIRRLQQLNPGPFPNAAVASVWTEIISACRGLERGMTVAYLGPQGSFSEQAALEHFGHAVQKLPCPSFDEVFRAVEAGQADVGMVPVENSTEGAVNRSLDLLLNTPLKILGERSLVIRHCLMSKSGGMDGIKAIAAHPQALAQCQGWLTRNYPDVERVAASSTRKRRAWPPPIRPSRRSPAKWPRRPGNCRWWPPASRTIRTTARASWPSAISSRWSAVRTRPA